MTLTLAQFKLRNNGRPIDVDGFPKEQPYQCWDLAELYSNTVVGVPRSPWALPTGDGCAAGVFANFPAPLPKYYKRIAYSKGSMPAPGDIVVWNYNLPGSEGCGHIDVALSANKNAFRGFDQNWGGAYAHEVYHVGYAYVLGYLRPIKNIKTPPKPAAKPVYYKLVPGDYLLKVASRFNTSLAKILKLNPRIKDPSKVPAGLNVRVK